MIILHLLKGAAEWGWYVLSVLALSVFVVLLGCAPAPAQSATPCAPRDRIVERLAQGYDEVQNATAIAANGAALELWVSGVGTWTIIVVRTDGLACLLASGVEWSGIAPMPSFDGQASDL